MPVVKKRLEFPPTISVALLIRDICEWITKTENADRLSFYPGNHVTPL